MTHDAAGDPLERQALEWVATYWNARHLVRTRDWLLQLEPQARLPLRLAALTHDMERSVPGGPRLDARTQDWDDRGYLAAHSERSAVIVADWLATQAAPQELIDEVRELVLAHEIGGGRYGDLLQAADSISFLEVNGDVARRWVREGRCNPRKALAKLDWMYERIRVPEARELARPFHDEAVRALLAGAGGAP